MSHSAEHTSPNDKYVLYISPVPMRMSHEVMCPSLYRKADNQLLFDPGDLWDATAVSWSADSQWLRMAVRCYDNGLRIYWLRINPGEDYAELTFEENVLLSGTMEEVGDKMATEDLEEEEE